MKVMTRKFIAVVVFFFKQKTAYEMRISDWSSDVCSSDLSSPDCGGSMSTEFPLTVMQSGETKQVVGVRCDAPARDRLVEMGFRQIGRAACRVIVCTYV